MIDCESGKLKRTADIKGNQVDGNEIKWKGNTIEGTL